MRDLRSVLVMLGVIGMWFGAWDLSRSRRGGNPDRLALPAHHRDARAYISAVTAFIVINAHSTPMIVRWLAPITVGGLSVVAFQFAYRAV